MDNNEMPEPSTSTRDACDRCHSMKTRCVRLQQSGECQRCQRMRVSCEYSPALKVGRPLGRKTGIADRSSRAMGAVQLGLKRRKQSREATTEVTAAEPTFASQLPAFEPTIQVRTEEPLFEEDPYRLGAAQDLEKATLCPPGLEGLEMLGAGDFVDFSVVGEPPVVKNNSSTPSTAFDHVPFGVLRPTPPRSLIAERVMSAFEGDDFLHRLLDLQVKLSGLIKSLTSGKETSCLALTPNAPGIGSFASGAVLSKNMEEVALATEDLVDIIEKVQRCGVRDSDYSREAELGMFTPSSSSQVGVPVPPRKSTKPHIATTLLVSSSYVRLIQVFELLVETLQQPSPSQPYHASNRGRPQTPQTPPGEMPMFRLGRLRLTIPPRLSTELHFHVVSQMVQRLRETMQSYAAYVENATAPGSANDFFKAMEPSGPSAIAMIVESVLSDVNTQEENLLTTLHRRD
ncbi:Zn(II)2Cys6 transcription factor domain-containing protein [Aspergillus thermomutatus]|uniref:Zn(2)-C6 fungal-type domain-containing protein n=1 Tax=Aspergillus thermomutatus TaxID=41047 RepID=A0A397HWG7_ASPTH|nr:uncharacterized protein CDV56_108926 [Aspergillus thermomutatus]RHZ64950.1 hypothetical protein CDV56_108926 [Aspergillus thermomutatus]